MWRRSSSARSTSSAARTSWSLSAGPSRPIWPGCAGAWSPSLEFLALGPDAVLYAILDQVVDEYEPVAAGLENDIDEIEDDLFAADPGVSRRIYELSRQVIMFQRATAPLSGILQTLMAEAPDGVPDPELQDHFRDVLDHALRLGERVAAFRALLQNALGRQRGPRGPAAKRRNAPPDGVELRPERAGQADLVVGGDPVRPDADRIDLRHELPRRCPSSTGFSAIRWRWG